MLGEYRHGLDSKNRIFIPAKMREVLGASFIVAKNFRANCLKIYSETGWNEYMAKVKNLAKQSLQEQIYRIMNSSAQRVSPDSQGRITLPRELVDFAGIVSGAVVVGCHGYAEIWADERYTKQKDEIDIQRFLEDLEELGL